MSTPPRFWLMKSEPDVFSLDDLKARLPHGELWDGVRNYQARNFMRDAMQRGDGVLFYHSNCAVPGVVGLARIVSEEAQPDPTQFDPASDYYDPKAKPESPRWLAAAVGYVAHFDEVVALRTIKDDAQLSEMAVAQRGQRLSIQPVEEVHFLEVCRRGGIEDPLARLREQ
ncbi:MAG: EVE domain-containing protein [Opitutales bacterium]